MPVRLSVLFACCALLLVAGCDKLSGLASNEPEHAIADTIYVGTVVTMDQVQPAAEAVAVKDGRIVAVGARTAVMQHKGPGTRVRELGNEVMLPGFVDTHSYFMKAVDVSGLDMPAAIEAVQKDYARNGYTTISNGTTSWQAYQALQQAAAANSLFLDVVAVADFSDIAQFAQAGVTLGGGDYDKHLRVDGVKLVVDGSPEEKMAYWSLPLLLADGPNGEKGWRGQANFSQEELTAAVADIIRRGARVVAEANGDAAIDMVITAVRANGVSAEQDRRDTVIHSQFLRPSDQMREYERAGLSPSFCTNRIYSSGDLNLQTVGGKRAQLLSPLKSAYYLTYSNHTDYPETSLNPMMTLWTATNRLTESGKVLDVNQLLDVKDALHAITNYAAWQYHEDASKGTITEGKVADFVLLGKNPLTVESMKLKNIQVLETIKGGKTVYRAE